jgi:hypothetical protein
MKIGRLRFGITVGGSDWGLEKFSCDCRILNLGRIYALFYGKKCKCGICKKHDCVCKCPLCGKFEIKCECEKFE